MLILALTMAMATDVSPADGCEDEYAANGACVEAGATIGLGTTIGADAVVGERASLGPNMTFGPAINPDQGPRIGARASMAGESDSAFANTVGTNVIIGRAAVIGVDATFADDTIFGRTATAGARLSTLAGATVGYGADLGDDVTLGAGAIIGNLATVGDHTSLGTNAVLARGVVIADGSAIAPSLIDGIVGPQTQIGAGVTIESGARVRKDAQIGAGAEVRGTARVGRGATVAAGAIVESGAQVRAGATVCEGQTMGSTDTVGRGETFPPEGCLQECIQPWLPVQGQGQLSDGVGTNTVWLNTPTTKNWNSAALSHDFVGDFQVTVSFHEQAIGAGAVYGPNVTYQDINGYAPSASGTYWGGLTVTGFPNNYDGSFAGYYPVNSGVNELVFVRWTRTGSSLAIEFSTSSSTGPWAHITNSPFSVPSTDTVVIGIGEGSGTDSVNDAVRLLSCSN